MARWVIRQYPLHSTELKKCFLLTLIHGGFLCVHVLAFSCEFTHVLS